MRKTEPPRIGARKVVLNKTDAASLFRYRVLPARSGRKTSGDEVSATRLKRAGSEPSNYKRPPTVSGIRHRYRVKSGQIALWLARQGGQPGDKVQRHGGILRLEDR